MELSNEHARLRVDLDGGRLASLVVHGHELLITEGAKPTRWGSFPMAPWAGRLPYGRLAWQGNVYDFPLTSPPHANHGVSHLQRWSQLDQHTITVDLAAPWPFGGSVTQQFVLTAESLTVSIVVSNDNATMPALVGWHPWFRRQLGAGDSVEVIVEPGRAYALDQDMIPTGALIDPPLPPWNETFVDLAEAPVLLWNGVLELTMTSSFDHWVVFTEPEHAVCIEPQSGPPNQLNSDPFLVGPGQDLSGEMTLVWKPLTGLETVDLERS